MEDNSDAGIPMQGNRGVVWLPCFSFRRCARGAAEIDHGASSALHRYRYSSTSAALGGLSAASTPSLSGDGDVSEC